MVQKHSNIIGMGVLNSVLTISKKIIYFYRDGITQQLGGCLRDFRNKPFPVRMKIEYYKRTLTISYHNGMSNDANAYEICTMIENVILPANGYFGVSAATGGLADDHDVLSFVTHSLIDQKLAVCLNLFFILKKINYNN